MEKELIGLRTTLYTFDLSDELSYEHTMNRLKNKGTITTVFINNKLAFEFKENINIDTLAH